MILVSCCQYLIAFPWQRNPAGAISVFHDFMCRLDIPCLWLLLNFGQRCWPCHKVGFSSGKSLLGRVGFGAARNEWAIHDCLPCLIDVMTAGHWSSNCPQKNAGGSGGRGGGGGYRGGRGGGSSYGKSPYGGGSAYGGKAAYVGGSAYGNRWN